MDAIAFRAEMRAGFAATQPRAQALVTGITDAAAAFERLNEALRAPRYRYLTATYVEWLGLPEVVLFSGTTCCAFVSENAPKPEASWRLRRAVRFEGHIYTLTEDKRAWDLVL